MASLNQCNFIGNIGKLETRFMPNGEAVTNISLACNETWKDKSGAKQEKCEWVNVTMYKKLAEIAGEYLKVGSQVFISGKMSTRKWVDKEGKDRFSTEIIAENMTMLGGKPEGQERQAAQQRAAPAAKPAQDQSSGARAFADFESDIPFIDPYRKMI